ncbi:vacuolar sorting protein did4 [Phaffia rhodozyma]|uniref:Vacuolar sorting protein did4 n=1 Tax=Phaffia rhodozyma TaxID=264483 RepID=A0A0F7SP72_PHARH|nr:vacuolar sorting protein did4 [Phaffia rhodozyma]
MNVLELLFGKSLTPAERLRQHQRALQKAQRELDRERGKLENEEKKIMSEIKRTAKLGQMNACKIMAKDLVRTRRYIQKFYAMKTQLQAVSLRIQTLRSNQQMGEAMKGATRAMGMMNRSMNLPQIQKIMMDFEKESATMDMKEEIMSDAVDDAMDAEGEEEEEEEGDRILKEVLDEIGVSLGQQLGDAPSSIQEANSPMPSSRLAVAEGSDLPPTPASAGGGGNPDEDALQARLNNLKR